jgi:hypothetical protein
MGPRRASGIVVLAAALTAARTGWGAPELNLARVAWLQGCWEARASNRVIEESWTAPRGGAMVGLGTTVRRDSLVEYELILLRLVDGALAYEAHPSGQGVATFTAREATDSTVIFRNPDHDYPQEVGYRRAGADSLIAWVDGTLNGKARRMEFRYARARCSGL